MSSSNGSNQSVTSFGPVLNKVRARAFKHWMSKSETGMIVFRTRLSILFHTRIDLLGTDIQTRCLQKEHQESSLMYHSAGANR